MDIPGNKRLTGCSLQYLKSFKSGEATISLVAFLLNTTSLKYFFLIGLLFSETSINVINLKIIKHEKVLIDFNIRCICSL